MHIMDRLPHGNHMLTTCLCASWLLNSSNTTTPTLFDLLLIHQSTDWYSWFPTPT